MTALAFQWKATPWGNHAVEPLGLLQAQGKDSVQSPWTTRVPRADPPPCLEISTQVSAPRAAAVFAADHSRGVEPRADATDPVSNCGHWPAPGFPIPTPAAGDSSGANANPAAAAVNHGGGDDPDDPTPPREEPPHPATRPAPLGSAVQLATGQHHWAASTSANGLTTAFARALATSPAPHGPPAAQTLPAAGAPNDPSAAPAAPLR